MHVSRLTGRDGGAFDVEVRGAGGVRTVIFAAGRGGSPARHHSLLAGLAESGCTVIAPVFEPLASPLPNMDDLQSRMRRIAAALDQFENDGAPVVGVGHSLGAAVLLMLAGAEGWTVRRERVPPEPGIDFQRLLLLAPALDFFMAPNAVAPVRVPLHIWAGWQDRIVTPDAVERFMRSLPAAQIEVSMDERAGHFTFMDEPPPGAVDTHPDRAGFIERLTRQVSEAASRQR